MTHRTRPKLRWQDLCPTCAKYANPDHPSDCACCRALGFSESILCDLNRADQEDDPDDFKCGVYLPVSGNN